MFLCGLYATAAFSVKTEKQFHSKDFSDITTAILQPSSPQ
jgi:hypothetical protein